MSKVNIAFEGGRKFKVDVRGHEFVTDLPAEKGGQDSGPTPPELFVASVGTCMGIFAAGYLKTAGFDSEGLEFSIDWDYSEDKSRISRMDVKVTVPNAELGARKRAILAAMDKCVIHKTLKVHPQINVEIEGE